MSFQEGEEKNVGEVSLGVKAEAEVTATSAAAVEVAPPEASVDVSQDTPEVDLHIDEDTITAKTAAVDEALPSVGGDFAVQGEPTPPDATTDIYAEAVRSLESEVTATEPDVTAGDVNITAQAEVPTVDDQVTIEDFASKLAADVTADAGMVAGAEAGVSVEMPAMEAAVDTPPATVSVEMPAAEIAMETPSADIAMETPPVDVAMETPTAAVSVEAPSADVSVETPDAAAVVESVASVPKEVQGELSATGDVAMDTVEGTAELAQQDIGFEVGGATPAVDASVDVSAPAVSSPVQPEIDVALETSAPAEDATQAIDDILATINSTEYRLEDPTQAGEENVSGGFSTQVGGAAEVAVCPPAPPQPAVEVELTQDVASPEVEQVPGEMSVGAEVSVPNVGVSVPDAGLEMKVEPAVEAPSVDMSADIEALPSPPTTEPEPISAQVEGEVQAEIPAVDVGTSQAVEIDTSAEAQGGLKVEQVDDPERISCEDDSMVEMEGLREELSKEMKAQLEAVEQQQQQEQAEAEVAPPQAEMEAMAGGEIAAPALEAEAVAAISPEVSEQASTEATGDTSDSVPEPPQEPIINLQEEPPIIMNGAPELWVTRPEMPVPEPQEVEALPPPAEGEQVSVPAEGVSEDVPQAEVGDVPTTQDETDTVSAEAAGAVQAEVAAPSAEVAAEPAAAPAVEDVTSSTLEQAEAQTAEAAPSAEAQGEVPPAPTTEAADIQREQTEVEVSTAPVESTQSEAVAVPEQATEPVAVQPAVEGEVAASQEQVETQSTEPAVDSQAQEQTGTEAQTPEPEPQSATEQQPTEEQPQAQEPEVKTEAPEELPPPPQPDVDQQASDSTPAAATTDEKDAASNVAAPEPEQQTQQVPEEV